MDSANVWNHRYKTEIPKPFLYPVYLTGRIWFSETQEKFSLMLWNYLVLFIDYTLSF